MMNELKKMHCLMISNLTSSPMLEIYHALKFRKKSNLSFPYKYPALSNMFQIDFVTFYITLILYILGLKGKFQFV